MALEVRVFEMKKWQLRVQSDVTAHLHSREHTGSHPGLLAAFAPQRCSKHTSTITLMCHSEYTFCKQPAVQHEPVLRAGPTSENRDTDRQATTHSNIRRRGTEGHVMTTAHVFEVLLQHGQPGSLLAVICDDHAGAAHYLARLTLRVNLAQLRAAGECTHCIGLRCRVPPLWEHPGHAWYQQSMSPLHTASDADRPAAPPHTMR